ncbi:MAG TPA: hypothetical protein ENJ18_10565 [Nannocystis exedens]|nr:hypothetical protein [Nannocystis exedens]
MVWNIYDRYREGQHDSRQINPETGTLKAAIVSSLYTPDQNVHEFFSDITNEVSGTGYTAGGNQCLNPAVTMDSAGLITFDADDPAQWAQDPAGFSNGRRFILYFDTGVTTTSRLLAFSDAEAADFGNVSGPLTLQMAAAGIWTNAR